MNSPQSLCVYVLLETLCSVFENKSLFVAEISVRIWFLIFPSLKNLVIIQGPVLVV